jgi:hypothetical protein
VPFSTMSPVVRVRIRRVPSQCHFLVQVTIEDRSNTIEGLACIFFNSKSALSRSSTFYIINNGLH